MKISAVVPLLNDDKDIVSFVEKLKEKLGQHSQDFEIILSTNLSFEFVEKLRQRMDDVTIVALKESDDNQQIVMAGIDKVQGDCAIIITPDYDVNIVDSLINDWQNGKKIVCLRRKHGKVGTFFAKLRLKFYNMFLFLFGDIFSIGILKDAQLLDRELVEKMKGEQDMAHRFRTMYAPLDYNSSVHDIEHSVEKFESKGLPKLDFWLGFAGSIITMLAFISCVILAISLEAPIWAWMLFFIFWVLFEFIFISLLVNATARVKIGILHNVDENGCIYNLVQEYFPVEKVVKTEKSTTRKKRILNDEEAPVEKQVAKKKTTKADVERKSTAKSKTTTEKNIEKKSVATKSGETKKQTKPATKTSNAKLQSKQPKQTKNETIVDDIEKLPVKKATTKKSTTKKLKNENKEVSKTTSETKPKKTSVRTSSTNTKTTSKTTASKEKESKAKTTAKKTTKSNS